MFLGIIGPGHEFIALAVDVIVPVVDRNPDRHPSSDLLPLPCLAPSVREVAVAVSPCDISVEIPIR